jgi:fluoride exporter
MSAFWIFLGGGLGSLARWGLSGWVATQFGQTFPWGTFLVNVSGSFLIGIIAAVTGAEGLWLLADGPLQFLILGVFGGYTTFSSFSIQTLSLAQAGQWMKAAANVVLSLVLCLAGVWLGHMFGLQLNSAWG